MQDQHFDQILVSLLSNDNSSRRQAEDFYENLKLQSPEIVGIHLLRVLKCRSAESEAVRALASVLLRLLLKVRSDFWPRLDSNFQNTVKETLMECISSEPVRHVQQKLASTIAQLATLTIMDSQEEVSGGGAGWPEVVQIMVQLCQMKDSKQCIAGLFLLDRLVEYVGNIPGLTPQTLLTLLQSTLTRPEWDVQVAALMAVCSVLQDILTPEDLQVLRPLLPGLLKVVENALNRGDEATAQEALTALGDVAEKQPLFLKFSLNEVGRAMLAVVEAQSLEVGTRQLALEFLTSLCEHLGSSLRKSAGWVLEAMIPLTMNILMQVEDDPSWVSRMCFDGEDEDDLDNLSEIAAMALDRISMAIGPAVIIKVLFPIASQCICDMHDWRRRRAGVMAMGLIAEGCKEEVYNRLSSEDGRSGLLQFMLPLARDSHPRVRDAVLTTLSIFSEDFKRMGFQRSFAFAVLPVLSESLVGLNTGIPRLQALACSSLTSFFVPGQCDARDIMNHASSLLQGLLVCLSGHITVQTSAITAVAMLATMIGPLFGQFYDSFIPLAKSILAFPETGPEVSLLKGKSMEAIALMGVAVGKDRFKQDAFEIVHALLNNVLQGFFESGDPQLAYALMSYTRIAGVLKEDFLQYLPNVLSTLLKVVSREVESSVVDADELGSVDQLFRGKDVVKVNVRGAGSHFVALNTSEVQEKELCAQTLFQLIKDMGVFLAPWVREIAASILPLLKYKVQQTLTIVAAASMPLLLTIALEGAAEGKVIPAVPQEMLLAFLSALLQVLSEGATQEELEPYCVCADSLTSLLALSIDHPASFNLADDVVVGVLRVLKDAAVASTYRSEQRQHAEETSEDVDAFEEAESWEKDLLTSILEGAGTLIKHFKENIFENFHSVFGRFLEENLPNLTADVAKRSFCYCLCIDAVENCGEQAQIYLPKLLEGLLQGLLDESAEIQQASAYGVGICAMFGGDFFNTVCSYALGLLFENLSSENAQTEEFGAASDNVISAILKICTYRPETCDLSLVLPQVFSFLPLQFDLVEAHTAHSMILQLIEQGSEDLLGKHGEHIPIVVQFLAEIMKYQEPPDGKSEYSDEEAMWDNQLISKDDRIRVEALLQKMEAAFPTEVMAHAYDQLNEDQRLALLKPTSSFS